MPRPVAFVRTYVAIRFGVIDENVMFWILEISKRWPQSISMWIIKPLFLEVNT